MKNLIETLMARERERCRCIVEEDFGILRNLLSESLIHTHTRGNTDGKESYLRYAQDIVEILDLKRESLRVIPICNNSAVMHGKQVNRARLRGKDGDAISVESMVTQVWALEADEEWRLVAFHATPLGVPPPTIQR